MKLDPATMRAVAADMRAHVPIRYPEGGPAAQAVLEQALRYESHPLLTRTDWNGRVCGCDYDDCHPMRDCIGPGGSDDVGGLCGMCWTRHVVIVREVPDVA